jgi:UDP-2,3-diacylglucosamine pyrophosphatase LpxH
MRLESGGIKLAAEAEQLTLDGRRLLVTHGDAFDSVVRYAKFLAHLGDWAYTVSLEFNRYFNVLRRKLGYGYWSLSAWAKRQVKEAVKAIDRFEAALAQEARSRGFDGVVCGHIHHAEMREVDGVLYINDGDWVESCTALVEHVDGRLELLEWAALNNFSFLDQRDRAPSCPEALLPA